MYNKDIQRYKRKQRAKNKLCTVCGRPVEDEKYMTCEKCRKKYAELMQERRKNKK